jgi:hypothetical protein
VAGPSWVRWLLAAVLLAVAGYCVARLVVAQRVPHGYPACHRAVDVAHLIMALGMAVMVSPVGGPVPAAGWETAFVLIAAWFLGAAARRGAMRPRPAGWPCGWRGGNLHHAAAALAMLYMITAMPADAQHMSTPWMAVQHTGSGPVGWILAGYFALTAVLLGHRVLWPAPAGTGLPAVLRAPRVAAGCQVAMAVSTAYMIMPGS